MKKIKTTKLSSYNIKYKKVTKTDIKLLDFCLGERICNNSYGATFINYYLISVVVVILFLIFSLDLFDKSLAKYIPSKIGRFLFKITIIFLIVYLFDRFVEQWRRKNTLSVDHI
jgi:ABC-type protease/lipase transport system fused ATPase/permease subunit